MASLGAKFLSESWQSLFYSAVFEANSALDSLFTGIDHGNHILIKQPENNGTGLRFQPFSGGVTANTWGLSRRYNAVNTLLKTMWSTEYPTSVHVPVDTLLNVLCKALAVDAAILKSVPNASLLSVLPLIHVETFTTLKSLVLVFRKRVISHLSTIVALVVKYLQRSGSGAYRNYRQPLAYVTRYSDVTNIAAITSLTPLL